MTLAMPLAILEPPLMLHLPAHRLVLLEPPSHRQIPTQLLLARPTAHRSMPLSFTATFTADAMVAAAAFVAPRLARATLDALHGLAAPTGLTPHEGTLLRGSITLTPLADSITLRLAIMPSRQFLARLALADLTATIFALSLAAASFAIRTLTTFTAIPFTLAPSITLSRTFARPITTDALSQRQRARADHDEQGQYLRRSTHE